MGPDRYATGRSTPVGTAFGLLDTPQANAAACWVILKRLTGADRGMHWGRVAHLVEPVPGRSLLKPICSMPARYRSDIEVTADTPRCAACVAKAERA